MNTPPSLRELVKDGEKALLWTEVADYQAFFDQDGEIITYHSIDDEIYTEESAKLHEHYNIKVVKFDLPQDIHRDLEHRLYDGNDGNPGSKTRGDVAENLFRDRLQPYVKRELE
ncbi:hypothetical protein KY327_02460 [Candidatus Woesearchaeota archaeon]|nr:hypothetical protein [Candidatus Woesearchaeota archaeon]